MPDLGLAPPCDRGAGVPAQALRPDLSTVTPHCRDHPAWFDCRLLTSHPHPDRPAWSWQGDRRIKALVVAAPALGFAFDRAGLASLTMPIQLWRADEDEILPAPDYADAVRAALPRAPEFHAIRKAGHFDFLMPCTSPDVLPEICRSRPDFDRAAFHRAFNARIVRFLTNVLDSRRAGSDNAAPASDHVLRQRDSIVVITSRRCRAMTSGAAMSISNTLPNVNRLATK